MAATPSGPLPQSRSPTSGLTARGIFVMSNSRNTFAIVWLTNTGAATNLFYTVPSGGEVFESTTASLFSFTPVGAVPLPPHSRSSPPASARWVCSAGAESGNSRLDAAPKWCGLIWWQRLNATNKAPQRRFSLQVLETMQGASPARRYFA